ncbi:hypothetical protein H696_00988 [Fonticula alba]|uniref:CCAAT-binding factor domain-containing protein n=1 Tax=Fonticula alba TaxID=691883 RepID=A0A058ZGI5_FONAL|nr:hypothetical protein H696_00988 [Fonticula alba]KCV73454.1 hypothetical protein H696_00988 [Fonticula alba]|eukprot:XP_009493155.1 hypothetical protein H696_00988 [Fonticula alba]
MSAPAAKKRGLSSQAGASPAAKRQAIAGAGATKPKRLSPEDFVALSKEIQEIVSAVRQDKRELNRLVRLEGLCKHNNSRVAHAAIEASVGFFSQFIGTLHRESSTLALASSREKKADTTNAKDNQLHDAANRVLSWTRDRYQVYVNLLVAQCAGGAEADILCCLPVLMQLLSIETQAASEKASASIAQAEAAKSGGTKSKTQLASSGVFVFSGDLLDQAMEAVLSHTSGQPMAEAVTKMLVERYLAYPDLRYFMLRSLRRLINRRLESAGPAHDVDNVTFAANVLELMLRVPIPSKDGDLMYFSESIDKSTREKVKKDLRSVYSLAWFATVRLPHSPPDLRRMLGALPRQVYPHLTGLTPLVDFLTELFTKTSSRTDTTNASGVLALLSLDSIYILMLKHNIEYPDFYNRLYSLCDDRLPRLKYRARFLTLTDLYLQSPLLPGYIVAGFIKRFARLALTAPPSTAIALLVFVYNLLKRHPSCMVLLHRPSSTSNPGEDVYNTEEPALDKCRAIDSSLWELHAMRSHYSPTVSNFVKNFMEPLRRSSLDLAQNLESTYESLFEAEFRRKKADQVPVTFERGVGLLPKTGLLTLSFFQETDVAAPAFAAVAATEVSALIQSSIEATDKEALEAAERAIQEGNVSDLTDSEEHAGDAAGSDSDSELDEVTLRGLAPTLEVSSDEGAASDSD